MTLPPNQQSALVRGPDLRDTNKPAWRAPVCRPVPLPASTLLDSNFSTDGFIGS
ncbi:hypothetical protein [Ancylobacter vacuolatus]|uniref:Uncharacterized protein n=1 Tax=Ancylobacter vacuolatus TaxID=223389 RepID=A0ABU0DG94_9HYPH|nr:hypothetical protein [Ancylobacter vacuolatus]MDQ0347427.1 hypothetical protein [Ancylobacter vacuolatus]